MDAQLVELVNSLGGGGTWGAVVLIIIAALRAAAATASKHITDEKLGKLAGPVNWIGGNTKNAANANEAG